MHSQRYHNLRPSTWCEHPPVSLQRKGFSIQVVHHFVRAKPSQVHSIGIEVGLSQGCTHFPAEQLHAWQEGRWRVFPTEINVKINLEGFEGQQEPRPKAWISEYKGVALHAT